MKLIELYRDVLSTLNDYNIENYRYGYNDIVSAINDSISLLRIQYIRDGRYQEFVETHSMFTTIEDFDYPFLSSIDLPKPILGEVPINLAIVSANVQQTTNEIKDEADSHPINTLAVKNNVVYKAIRDITNENTFDKTFDISNVSHYKPNNGLKYNEGDVIKDVTNNKYYRVDSEFIAKNGITPSLTELAWQMLYENNKPVFFYEFTSIAQMKLFSNYNDDAYVFSVVRDKVYIAPKTERFTISYIPRWERVQKRDDELTLPDFMIPSVKQQSIRSLLMKAGVQPQEEATQANEA